MVYYLQYSTRYACLCCYKVHVLYMYWENNEALLCRPQESSSRSLVNGRRKKKSCDIVINLVKDSLRYQDNSLTFKNVKRNTWIQCSVVTRVNPCIIEYQLINLQRAVLQEAESEDAWRHHPSSFHHLRDRSKLSSHAPADRRAGFNRWYTTWQSNIISK